MIVIYKRFKSFVIAVFLFIFFNTSAIQGIVAAPFRDVPFPIDTIRSTIQECDSFYFALIDSTYRESTWIEYAHTVEIEDTTTGDIDTVVDSLFIYNLIIGTSYDYRDTVPVNVCANKLPFHYLGQSFPEPGDYEVEIPTLLGCDSINRLLQLQLFPTMRDTIRLGACANNFSVRYENITFSSPGTFTHSISNDTNGCPIITTFIISRYMDYHDTIVADICAADTPYVALDTFFTASTVYQKNYISQHGCDSIYTLILTVYPDYALTDTITQVWPYTDLPYRVGDSCFYETGIYDFPLHTINGCDSIDIHLDLVVDETHYDTACFTLCHNEFPFDYNGNAYSRAGQYEIVHADTLPYRCATRLILNELPSYDDTLHIELCQSELPYTFSDSIFLVSTIYTHIDTTVAGCDSLTTLDLTIHPTYAVYDTFAITVCRNKLPYSFGDSLLRESGDYDFIKHTVFGCDSAFIHFHLVVEENPHDTLTLALCANDFPYTYKDTSLYTAGDFDIIVPDTTDGGCDTLRHLIVEVLPIYHNSVFVTICANSSYIIGDSILQEQGVYDIPLVSEFGCDSMVTVTIMHYPIYTIDTLNFSICETKLPFVYAGSEFNDPGFHVVRLATIHGCDSLIPFNLTIIPAIYNSDTLRREICANELPIMAFDSTLTEAGLYTFTATSAVTGYDSIFYLRLIVYENPVIEITGKDYLCPGTTSLLTATPGMTGYHWNNGFDNQMLSITLAGTYSVTGTDEHGCSNTASLTVSEASLPNILFSGNQEICAGQSTTLTATGGIHYTWDNGSATESITVIPSVTTTYRVTVANATQCISVGEIEVIVHDLPTVTISGNTAICQEEHTTFLATGGIGYLWSTGETTDNITVSAAGNYTVTVTDENGCTQTGNQILTVYNNPVIRINGRTEFCQGGTTILTATGASEYQWNSGETTASITTGLIGTYTVTGTSVEGCSATATTQISIKRINASITGNRSFCHGENTTLTVSAEDPYTYQWYDGNTTNAITVSSAGQYSVTVTDALGCTNVISANVTEHELPVPSISGNLTICEGRSTVLRAGGGISYLWDDGSTQTYLTANTIGTYAVTVTDQNGCSAATSATVIVNPLPEITLITTDNICIGDNVSIYAICQTGTTYAWASGQNTPIINVSPTSTTTYTVLVTDDNNCSKTATATITVNPLPIPYINAVSDICRGDTALLTAQGGDTYQWSNGLTTKSIATTNAGTYTATVTNAAGCSASASTTITVNALPVISISENLDICQGQSGTLSVTGPPGNIYRWNTGSSQNSITVTDAGIYTVTATNAAGCTATAMTNVAVNARPDVVISGKTQICSGETTMLTAISGDSCLYSWNDGSQNALLNVSTAGTYIVTATNPNGCTATASVVVVENALPQPVITGVQAVCPNDPAILTVSPGKHYLWSTGDTTGTIIVNPTAISSYFVTVTDEHGCTGSAGTTISINVIPDIRITGDTEICEGESAVLHVTSGYQYLWSTNDTTESLTVTEAGTYTVTATNEAGCTATATTAVIKHALPDLFFGGQHSICEGETYTYTIPFDSNLTYLWSNSATTNTITVSTAGDYTITVTTPYGCSRSATDVLTVNPLPIPNITGNTSICQGSYTILTATGGSSYVWSDGTTGSDMAVYPTTNTTYTVTAYSEYGCTASTSATVILKVLPFISFTGNLSFCEGGSTSVTASGGSSYLWSTGSTSSSVTFDTEGTYYVTATNSLGCQNSNSVHITMYENPIISISGSDYLCKGDAGSLSAYGATLYYWSTGEQDTTINIMPTATCTYTVTGYNSSGCSSTVSKVVMIEELPDVQISGTLAICLGDSTSLTASNGDSYLWSNGSTSTTIQVFEAGNYGVTATSPTGCTASATATVIVNPTPTAVISGNSTLCANETQTLTASGGSSYLWNTHETTADILVSDGGTYQVTATNDYGCSSTAAFNISLLNVPFLNIIGNSTICEGSTSELIASTNATHFNWSTNETTQSIDASPDETTLYTVTVTDENGCRNTDSLTLIVHPVYIQNVTDEVCQGTTYTAHGFNLPIQDTAGTFIYDNTFQSIDGCDSTIRLTLTVNPLPIMPNTIDGPVEITNYGQYLYTVVGAAHVDNYEWRISNLNWTFTDNTINPILLDINSNGNGILTAKGINACGYDETSISIYCNVGIDQYTDDTHILLYPNPVRQTLNINFENAEIPVSQIQLFDILGQCLQTFPVKESQYTIDCSHYAAGTYFIKFFDSDGNLTGTRKIIIHP